MKKIKIISMYACVLAMTSLLAACAAQPVDAEESSTTETAPVSTTSFEQLSSQSDHSLIATHPQALSGEPSTAYCLSCHDYAKLADDSETTLLDEGGKTKFNPHAGHVEYQCIDCHSTTEDPVLRCNSCHYITTPNDWKSPEENAKAQFMDPGTIYGQLEYATQGDSYAMGEYQGYGF